MAPPLDWNPNGNYVFDDSSFHLKYGSGNPHIRHKRGGGGGKPQVADAALQYNSVEANTAAPPGKSIYSYLVRLYLFRLKIRLYILIKLTQFKNTLARNMQHRFRF